MAKTQPLLNPQQAKAQPLLTPQQSILLSAGMYNSKPLANVAFTPNAGLTYDGSTGWGNALGVRDNSGKYSNWNKPYTGLTPEQMKHLGNILTHKMPEEEEEESTAEFAQNTPIPAYQPDYSGYTGLNYEVNPYEGVSPEFLNMLRSFRNG